MVIRAAVEDDWQGPVRVDTSAEGRQRKFGDRDEDSPNTLVTNAENLLTVFIVQTRLAIGLPEAASRGFRTCDDDVVDIFRLSPLSKVVANTFNVVDVQETSVGPPEDARESLDGIAFGRSIHDAEHFGEVVEEELQRAISP